LFMIMGQSGPYLAKATHDHGSALAGWGLTTAAGV
jgi:hypothetical protein